MASICVFCASSSKLNSDYEAVAQEVGELIGNRGHSLVFGGSDMGLMGITAEATHKTGGKVVSIIPEFWKSSVYKEGEIIITKDLRDRKAVMLERTDAYLALPGGLGTLDEIADTLVDKYIETHAKPLVLLNTNDFYNHLLAHFEQILSNGLAEERMRELYHTAATPIGAIAHIERKLQD